MEIDQFQMNREIQKCARDEFRGSTDLAQLKIDGFGTTEKSEAERKEVWRATNFRGSHERGDSGWIFNL